MPAKQAFFLLAPHCLILTEEREFRYSRPQKQLSWLQDGAGWYGGAEGWVPLLILLICGMNRCPPLDLDHIFLYVKFHSGKIIRWDASFMGMTFLDIFFIAFICYKIHKYFIGRGKALSFRVVRYWGKWFVLLFFLLELFSIFYAMVCYGTCAFCR